jgi:hypothetical protein
MSHPIEGRIAAQGIGEIRMPMRSPFMKGKSFPGKLDSPLIVEDHQNIEIAFAKICGEQWVLGRRFIRCPRSTGRGGQRDKHKQYNDVDNDGCRESETRRSTLINEDGAAKPSLQTSLCGRF